MRRRQSAKSAILSAKPRSKPRVRREEAEMSKAHRGKGLKEVPAGGRGTCPICGRTGVKVVYEQEIDGKKTKICKICKAHLAKVK